MFKQAIGAFLRRFQRVDRTKSVWEPGTGMKSSGTCAGEDIYLVRQAREGKGPVWTPRGAKRAIWRRKKFFHGSSRSGASKFQEV